MNSTKSNMKYWPAAVVIIASILMSVAALGQDSTRVQYADRGFYIGLSVPYVSVDGADFDGTSSTWINGTEALSMTDIDPGPGLRGVFGIRLGGAWTNMDWGLEFNVQWSDHDGYWRVFTPRTDVITSGLDARVFFLIDERIQPSLQFGFLYAAAISSDFPDPIDSNNGMDTQFFGYGGEFGGGLNLYLTPQVGLVLGGNLRPMIFTMGKGTGDELEELDASRYALGWDIHVGLSFTIPVSSFND